MNSSGLWEQIYLHCLEIRDIEAGQEDSLRNLREHLSTIELLMPDDLEPDSQFELYVVARLCRYIEHLLAPRQ